MERSQSCTNFDTNSNCNTNNNVNINNTTNNNNNNNNNNNSNSDTLKFTKIIEMRQNQLHKQQNFQLLQHSGSSDNIKAYNNSAVNFSRFQRSHLRKRTLQRQKSTEYMDEGDLDYAADEEDEDDTRERLPDVNQTKQQLSQRTNDVPTILPLHKKHLQFRKHKPLSETALLTNITTPLNSPLSANSTSSFTTTSSTSTINASSTSSIERQFKHEDSFDSTADSMSPLSRRRHAHYIGTLQRDNSIQSDSSRYSSVDSLACLLDARKPDPEAILINLGFGPIGSEDILSRIPKRFLKPSQVRGIDTEAFVKRLQLANNLADQLGNLGYRGLTGNPDIQPSTIVAKIMERFEVNERKKSMSSIEHTIR